MPKKRRKIDGNYYPSVGDDELSELAVREKQAIIDAKREKNASQCRKRQQKYLSKIKDGTASEKVKTTHKARCERRNKAMKAKLIKDLETVQNAIKAEL